MSITGQRFAGQRWAALGFPRRLRRSAVRTVVGLPQHWQALMPKRCAFPGWLDIRSQGYGEDDDWDGLTTEDVLEDEDTAFVWTKWEPFELWPM